VVAELLRPLDAPERCCNNATIQHIEHIDCKQRAATSFQAAQDGVEKTKMKRSSRKM
jgi:hypothetical protein